MKKFTKKLKTKIGALIGCVSAFVLTLGIGIASLPESSVVGKATSTEPTVTNVEDLITSDALTGTGASLNVKETRQSTNLTTWNNIKTVTNSSGNTFTYELYNEKSDSTATGNGNDYAGNISVYTTETGSSNGDMLSVVFLESANTQLMSFRTKYTTNEIALAMRAANSGYNITWGTMSGSGYAFYLNRRGTTDGRYSLIKCISSGREDAFTNAESGTVTDGVEKQFDNDPKVGDDLLITYGCYDTTYNDAAAVALRLKIENLTTGDDVIDALWYDTNPDTTVYPGGTGSDYANSGYFRMAVQCDGGLPLTIGGVEHPIFMETKTYQAEKSYALNTPLTTVQEDLAGTGFALTNTTGNLSVGAVAYDGTYEAEYYEKTIQYPAKITVSSGVTNIETLVDYNIEGSTKFNIKEGNSGAKLTEWNTLKKTDKDNGYVSYVANNDTAVTDTTQNGNAYDGNISIYGYTDYDSYIDVMSVNLVGDYSNEIVSFRTKYTQNELVLGMRMAEGSNVQASEITSGYYFTVSSYRTNSYRVGKGIGSGRDYVHIQGSTGTEVDTHNTAMNLTGLTQGDDIIITYGCYDTTYNDAAAVALYLKIEKTDGTAIVNETWYDTAPTESAPTNTNMLISTHFTKGLPQVFGGVEKPLYEQCYAYDGEVSGEAGAALSTVQLDDGYTWKAPDTVISADTTEYAATYSGTYYDRTFTTDVTVTVQVLTTGITTLQFKSASGDSVLIEKQIEQGNTYTFDAYATEKTFIGWAGSDGLYPAGYEFTATASEDTVIVYTLVDIDISFEQGAAVRLIGKTDKVHYYGGLRFTLAVNTEEYSNSSYINGIYAGVVPYDAEYYTNGAFTGTALKKAQELKGENTYSKSGFDGYTLYGITLTNIKYSNYNRDFVGMAYIVVEYVNGADKVQIAIDETANVRSVHTVATKVYAKHLQRANANNGVGIYNPDQVAILEDYVFGVVDLTFKETTDGTATLAVVEDQDGLDDVKAEDRGYSLTAQTVTDSDGDGTYEVQISVQIDVDETLYQDNSDKRPHIPVTVRMLNDRNQVVAVLRVDQEVTGYVDGVATINFEITPLTE